MPSESLRGMPTLSQVESEWDYRMENGIQPFAKFSAYPIGQRNNIKSFADAIARIVAQQVSEQTAQRVAELERMNEVAYRNGSMSREPRVLELERLNDQLGVANRALYNELTALRASRDSDVREAKREALTEAMAHLENADDELNDYARITSVSCVRYLRDSRYPLPTPEQERKTEPVVGVNIEARFRNAFPSLYDVFDRHGLAPSHDELHRYLALATGAER